MNESKQKIFINDLKKFIARKMDLESSIKDSMNCCSMFDNEKIYENEEKLMSLVTSTRSNKKNTTEQGDSLEYLMKALFGRVKFIDNVEVTNRDIAIGQIDLQLNPIDERAYDVLGLVSNKPLGLIGECKNYTAKVGKEEIEKICWRCCKSGFLSFFIGSQFTAGALDEVDEFNLYKENICKKHCGVFVVPLNLEMIKIIIEEKINFCYFIQWAIQRAKSHNLTHHLRG